MIKTMFPPAPPLTNDKNGSGKYRCPRRRKRKQQEEKEKEFKYLDNLDPRMRFNNAKDPIYFAFEYLEKRSLPELMGDFIQDSFFEIANFVSKVGSQLKTAGEQ